MEDIKDKVAESVIETPEELAEQIKALQAKMTVAVLAEKDEEKAEEVEMAIANLTVIVAKGHEVPKSDVTAAECALLVAQFHKEAGGLPIKEIHNVRTVKRDPRAEKARLARRYGFSKVEKLYPGSEPKLPVSFKRALGIGAATVIKPESLGEFHIRPDNTGEGD